MKRAKKYSIGAAVIAAMTVAAILTGCVVGDSPTGKDGEGDAITFTLELPGPTPVATRAPGTATENRISSLRLLLCEPGPDGALIEAIAPDYTTADTGNTMWIITADIPHRPAPYDLLFVANHDCSALTAGSDTQSTIQSTLKASITPGTPWSGPIPMFGVLRDQTIANDNYEPPGRVALRRAMARVNVTVADEEGLRDAFVLTSIHLFNYASEGHVVPTAAAIADPSKPSATTAADNTTDPIVYTTGDGEGTWSSDGKIYIFENTRGTIYPAADWHDAPCIVVGGRFNGAAEESFYRLDFADNARPLDVVRNHSYNFTIVEVAATGYPTPGEARDNYPVGLTASLVPWDEASLTGPVNGRTYTVTVGSATGGTVVANYPKAHVGMILHAAAVPNEGYRFVSWTTLPADLLSDPAANPATFTMPSADVTLTPMFRPSARKNMIHAAPGMVGIKKSAYDWLTEQREIPANGADWIPRTADHWKPYTDVHGHPLTLKGSSTYKAENQKDNDLVEKIAIEEHGGLEDEPVYTLYFKWGSMVAMIGGQDDPWSIDDVVWVNPEFDPATITGDTGEDSADGHYGDFWGADNNDANYHEDCDIDYNPSAGHGDICDLLTGGNGSGGGSGGGTWRIPGGDPWQLPDGTTPWGDGMDTWELSQLNGVQARWESKITNPNGYISIGFGDQGAAMTYDGKFFLPAAGVRGRNNGTAKDQGSDGSYWSSTSIDVPSTGRHSLSFASFRLFSSWASTGNFLGMAVRCVKNQAP